MKNLLLITLTFVLCLTAAAQDYQLNGNLGLGTNPDAKLDVDGDSKLRGDTEVQGDLKLTNTTTKEGAQPDTDYFLIQDENGNVQKVSAEEVQNLVYGKQCELLDPTAPVPVKPTWTHSTGIIYVCHPGIKVGIGTNTPEYTLDVNGTGRFAGVLKSYRSEILQGGLSVQGETSMLSQLTLDASNLNPSLHALRVESASDWSKPISVYNQAGHESFRVHGNGEVRTFDSDGMATHVLRSDGSHKLRVDENSANVFEVRDDGQGQDELRFKLYNDGSYYSKLRSDAEDALVIEQPGSNNTKPVFLVESNGNTYCSKVTVANVGEFPDYVFTPDYELMPIAQLKTYIETNGHLPNMPTAEEVVLTGIDLGEMNRLLVEKVEELTLYIIELNEKLEGATSDEPTEALSE